MHEVLDDVFNCIYEVLVEAQEAIFMKFVVAFLVIVAVAVFWILMDYCGWQLMNGEQTMHYCGAVIVFVLMGLGLVGLYVFLRSLV